MPPTRHEIMGEPQEVTPPPDWLIKHGHPDKLDPEAVFTFADYIYAVLYESGGDPTMEAFGLEVVARAIKRRQLALRLQHPETDGRANA